MEAAEAVEVDYSVLPVVTDPLAAMEPGAPAVWDEYADNIGLISRYPALVPCVIDTG